MDTKKVSQTGELRLRLLRTAADIISVEGIKKLTLRSLSNRVGVSRTAPYRHFKNKDALLLAIAEEGFNELTSRYRKINRNSSLDSLSKLRNIGLAYIEFAILNPGAFKLMFGQEMIQHDISEKLCSDARETFNEFLMAVKVVIYEKDIAKFDYSILANYFWTIVHGLAILLVDGQIQVTGNNAGLPTLLNDQKSNITGNDQSMITYSKQTIMHFWNMILNGILEK